MSKELQQRLKRCSPSLRQPIQIVISIQPQYANHIASGSKTVEFRRRFPSDTHINGTKIWIYSTAPVKAVIALARVEGVERLSLTKLWKMYGKRGGVDRHTFNTYFSGVSYGCAISLVKIKRLKNVIDAKHLGAWGFTVPQSYRYVTDDIAALFQNFLCETTD